MILSKNDTTWTERVFEWLTILLAFCLPVYKKIMPLIILLWIISSMTRATWRHIKPGAATVLTIGVYYLMNVLWIFKGFFREEALFNLEVKASFLIFPLVFLFHRQIPVLLRMRALLAFVWGSLSFIVGSLAYAVFDFSSSLDPLAFTYSKLALWFHPTYLATYLAFSLLITGWLDVKGVHLWGSRKFHHFVEIIMVLYIGLLASKAGYLSAMLAMLFVGLFWYRRRRTSFATVYLVVGTMLLSATVYFSPKSQSRFKEMVSAPATDQLTENSKPFATGSTGMRVVAWKASLELLMKHPLGVGTGDVTPELVRIYQREGEHKVAEKQLNSHNQFLQAAVAFGWPGVLIVIALMWFATTHALRKKDFIFLGLIAIIGMNMLFESFWELQAGVIFTAFWFCLLTRSEKALPHD
jgi:O-antigen ligase